MADPQDLSFEDALKRLEAIVHELESGDATLDRSIDLYTEGEAMRRQCEARLRSAQLRVEQITLSADGKPTGSRPFDGE